MENLHENMHEVEVKATWWLRLLMIPIAIIVALVMICLIVWAIARNSWETLTERNYKGERPQ
jgi:hypothetical protein